MKLLLQYDFQGRKDLVKFVKTVGNAGLYVHLRIGPFVCAEWNYGCGEIFLIMCHSVSLLITESIKTKK